MCYLLDFREFLEKLEPLHRGHDLLALDFNTLLVLLIQVLEQASKLSVIDDNREFLLEKSLKVVLRALVLVRGSDRVSVSSQK